MWITSEENVSMEWLKGLFKEPYFKSHIDSDGDLYITSGLDFPIWMKLHEEQKLARYFTHVRRGDGGTVSEAAVNYLNASVLFPSFHVSGEEDDRFLAKYVVSYAECVVDAHVLAAARHFAGACVYAAEKLAEYSDPLPIASTISHH